MDQSEKLLTERESLALIAQMINKAKDNFSENGHLYLVWGWVVLICSLAHFIIANYTTYASPYLVWSLAWLVVVYQVIYHIRRKRKERVKTYTHEIVLAVWLTFFVLMFLFGFLFGVIIGNEYYKFIYPGFLALYGMPTFLSGVIVRFRPLIVGGVCCWLLAVLSTVTHFNFQVLLLGAAVIIGWIIPGYILRDRFKKLNS